MLFLLGNVSKRGLPDFKCSLPPVDIEAQGAPTTSTLIVNPVYKYPFISYRY